MRRRRLLTFFIVLFAMFCGVYGFGTNLPQTHEVSVKTVYHQPRAQVWEAISHYETAVEWSPSLQKVERIDDLDGLPVWRFYDKDGHHMDVQVIESRAPERHVSRIVATDYPYMGSWTFELQDAGDKTLVILTEEGKVESPLWRLVMRYLMGQDRMVRAFLLDLGHKFGETPHIVG
jgi:uncharacterized protein YndB with AHSA1/START domain